MSSPSLGAGVKVGFAVGVNVRVGAGVFVAVDVKVRVGVKVAVFVAVAVGVKVAVGVNVGVAVAVGSGVGVGVGANALHALSAKMAPMKNTSLNTVVRFTIDVPFVKSPLQVFLFSDTMRCAARKYASVCALRCSRESFIPA